MFYAANTLILGRNEKVEAAAASLALGNAHTQT
jgi:hypothetical protein